MRGACRILAPAALEWGDGASASGAQLSTTSARVEKWYVEYHLSTAFSGSDIVKVMEGRDRNEYHSIYVGPKRIEALGTPGDRMEFIV